MTEATLQLRQELLEFDVDAVELAHVGEPPPGTRAVDFVALGALVVTLANSKILSAVVGALGAWVGRQPQRSIKLKLGGDDIELSGVSSDEQRRLAEAWLRRHTKR